MYFEPEFSRDDVCKIRVVHQRYVGEGRPLRRAFVPVVVFGLEMVSDLRYGTGDVAQLRAGDNILITGRLETYSPRQGQDQLQVVASDITPLGHNEPKWLERSKKK